MQRELDEWLQMSVKHQNEPEPAEVVSEGMLTIAQPCHVADNLCHKIHGLDETLSPEEQTEEIKLPLAVGDSPLLSWNSLDQLKKRLVYDICPKVVAALVNSLWQ